MNKINDLDFNKIIGGAPSPVKIFETAQGKWVATTGRTYDSIPDREFLGGKFVKIKDGGYVRTLWDEFDTQEKAEKFDSEKQGLVSMQPYNPDRPTVIEIPVNITIKS